MACILLIVTLITGFTLVALVVSQHLGRAPQCICHTQGCLISRSTETEIGLVHLVADDAAGNGASGLFPQLLLLLRSFAFTRLPEFAQNGLHPCNVFFDPAILMWTRQLPRSSLHTEIELFASQAQEFLVQLLLRLSSEVNWPSSHHLSCCEGGLEWQLGRSQAKRFARHILGYTFHLIQNTSRLDLADPVLNVALALTLSNFEGLLS